ncbi:hypothetical protein D0T85_14260 [Bacteroides sp. 519]|nr:hypothetical protein [Bacteroides sp. 519]
MTKTLNITTYRANYEETASMYCYDFTLGKDLLVKQQLFSLYGFKNIKNSSNSLYRDSSVLGIIGLDLISKFDWFFDFDNKIVKIYKRGSRGVLLQKKEDLLLKKERKKKAFHCKISLNDSISQRFLFDTGFGFESACIGDYEIATDMIFSDSSFYYFNKKVPNCMNVDFSDSIDIQVIQSLKIEDCDFQNLIAFKEEFNYSNINIFSIGFLRRFNEMYYDSEKNEILLFKDESFNNTQTNEFIYRTKKFLTDGLDGLDSLDYYEHVQVYGGTIHLTNDSTKTSVESIFKN